MKQVVIMPGGFHPFHAGHYALYKQAQDAFPGADVYVAATNDTSTRPFPFALKEKLAKLAGVDPKKFIQVKSPFRAMEIVGHLDPADTQLIFVRSEKDANKPPQAGGVKKDGQPAYLQLLKGQTELAPMSQHAYMAYLPTVEFGPGMTSATEIRTAWPTLNEKRKTALVMSLYPKTQKNPKLAATVVAMLDMAIIGEELREAAGEEFILYINGKPAAKYTNLGQAEQDLLLIKNKVPTAKFEIKKEVCNMVAVPIGLKEALLKEFAQGVAEGSLNEFVLPGGGGGDNYGGDLHDILMAYISRNEPELLADFGEDEIDSVVADMVTMGMFDDIDPNNEEDLEDALDKIIDILTDDLPEQQGMAEGSGDGYYYLQGGIERSKKFASEAEAMAHSKQFFQLARVRRVTLKYKEPGQPAVVVKEFSFKDTPPPKSQMSWGDFYLQGKKQGMAEGNPNQQLALYKPDSKTYRGQPVPGSDTVDPDDITARRRRADSFSHRDVDKSQTAHDPEQTAHQDQLKRMFDRMLQDLPSRMKQFVYLRYHHDMTLDQVAQRLGIATETARQIEAKMLRKLKGKHGDELRKAAGAPEPAPTAVQITNKDAYAQGQADAQRGVRYNSEKFLPRDKESYRLGYLAGYKK